MMRLLRWTAVVAALIPFHCHAEPAKSAAEPQKALAEQDCRGLSDAAARLACYDAQSANNSAASSGKKAAVAAKATWEIRKSKDAMTDKMSCILSPKARPYIQISPNELWISFKSRGGIQSFQYRIDDNPPSKTNLPSRIEQQINALHIEGAEFAQIMKGNRLRVSTYTVLNAVVEDDIAIADARPLYAKLMVDCSK